MDSGKILLHKSRGKHLEDVRRRGKIHGYNRSVRIATLLVCLLGLIGCGRGIETKEAVRQGVLDYLSSRTNLNISSMQVDVSSVVFRNNEADAVVTFAAKGSTNPSQGMEMRYTLEKKGNHWVVKHRADSGKSPHGGGAANPHGGGMGDAGQMPGTAPQMPPLPGEIPPGHPPMPGSPEKNPKTK